MDVQEIRDKFLKLYGKRDEEIQLFFAPGRVNLIGEHTDYNGGNVFPCALSFGTYAAVRKRQDNIIKFTSGSFGLQVTTDTGSIEYIKEHDWANYPKGIIKYFMEMGFLIDGFEVLYEGNIPNSAGLSSSASIELVTAVMLKELFNCNIDMLNMVKLAQRAENKYVGVNCGIMDQFAIGMGKRHHAVLLNCTNMEYKYVPLNLEGYKIVISNTNKRRGLSDSKYNERRAECERAVAYLRKGLDIRYLAELGCEAFEKYKYLIEDENALKRASHIVYENLRTLDAVEKLSASDLKGFGTLMNESHESLRYLYEVTGFELDTLAEEAWKVQGVLGSRMTGAGFGGCTVSIVKEEALEEFKTNVGENYKRKTGLSAEFYIADAGDGARQIE